MAIVHFGTSSLSVFSILLVFYVHAADVQAAPAAAAAGENAATEQLAGIREVYEDPQRLGEPGSGILCLLDTEHPDVVRADVKQKGTVRYKNRLLKADLERLSGAECVLVHYTQVTRRHLSSPGIKALVITARKNRIDARYDEELFAAIRETKVPTIGFCGGHQLIAQAYGGRIAPMRSLRPGEEDPRPQYWPGQLKEWGFYPIEIVRADPLFAGLGSRPVVREFHAFEIAELPEAFDVLARSPLCAIQAIRHRKKPLYGTQFHPERYDADHPDGEQILVNFLRLAGFSASSSKP